MITISVSLILKKFQINFMNKGTKKSMMKLILHNLCRSSKLITIRMKMNPINSKK